MTDVKQLSERSFYQARNSMTSADSLNNSPWWNFNTTTTTTPLEARQRLDAILSDKLLWFNPYLIADRPLLECAERGRWLSFPSLTQMLVYHFSDIRPLTKNVDPVNASHGLFYRIGNLENEGYMGIFSLTHPLTHIVERNSIWTLINGRHLVPSNSHSLEGRDCFVSHAIDGIKVNSRLGRAFNMHFLSGSEKRRADIVRKSMYESKITMLNEVLKYPIHPHYLGNACTTFDYKGAILRAIETIKKFPAATPPTTHIINSSRP